MLKDSDNTYRNLGSACGHCVSRVTTPWPSSRSVLESVQEYSGRWSMARPRSRSVLGSRPCGFLTISMTLAACWPRSRASSSRCAHLIVPSGSAPRDELDQTHICLGATPAGGDPPGRRGHRRIRDDGSKPQGSLSGQLAENMRRCAPTHWIARSLERRPVIVKTGHERRAVLVRYVSAPT